MTTMKIYISGKISGIEETAAVNFKVAEKGLELCGFTPVNPMELKHNHDKTWQSYMKESIKALCDCDAIFMLLNWEESKGAQLEKQIAINLNMSVLYQKQQN